MREGRSSGSSGPRRARRALAVLTSGGDAPGMNAAVRAVVRAGVELGLDVWGVERGFAGLLEGQFRRMDASSVSNTIQRGGTALRTARSAEFMTRAGRARAARELHHRDIDTLVVIGGDGTFRGAQALAEEHQVKVIGLPGTIDNDIALTDSTIGYDTSVNTAVEAIDRIRDTAASHERAFVVEVMGRASGHIAIAVALACGAEAVLIPELKRDLTAIAHKLERGKARGKSSSIVVATEGKKAGEVYGLAEQLAKKTGVEMRVVVLGHIQRGGSPTARDRILATRLGAAAAHAAFEGRSGVMIGERDGRVVEVSLAEVTRAKKRSDLEMYELADILSR